MSKLITEQVNQIFESNLGDNVPGAAVRFLQKGSVIFESYFGMANLEEKTKITHSSIFSLASVSKQITAFVILLLKEKGALNLESDIRSYLPNFPDYGAKITPRMLIEHTSGIREHLNLLGKAGFFPNDVITKRDAEQIVYRQRELNFAPGSEFSYSNSGYLLLAEIVEKISGQSFAEFCTQHVFAPLGMNASFVKDDLDQVVPNLVESYYRGQDQFFHASAQYAYYGSTNLYTTLNDLTKWCTNFDVGTIGSEDTLAKMNRTETDSPYSFGQFHGLHNGLPHIFHSGGDAGYRAFLGRFPEQEAAVLLLSNDGGMDVQAKALQIADLFLQPFYKNGVAKPSIKQQEHNISPSAEALAQFEGSYFNLKTGIRRDITLKDGSLIYSRPEQGGRETTLRPLSETQFSFSGAHTSTVSFEHSNPNTISVMENGVVVETYTRLTPIHYLDEELKLFVGSFYSPELETRYEIKLEAGSLCAHHPKIGRVTLDPIAEDTFSASSWQYHTLVFDRSGNKAVSGFRISSDRALNVKFLKQG